MFNELLDGRHGKAELYLLPLVTGGGKFAAPNHSIDYLETVLIGRGIERNENLLNISKTRMKRRLEIVGVMNTSRRARSGLGKKMRNMFGW